jgi:hypothetical protein
MTGECLRDCRPYLGEGAMAKFFNMCHVLANVQMKPDREDVIAWQWSNDGVFSAKSTYNAFFAYHNILRYIKNYSFDCVL